MEREIVNKIVTVDFVNNIFGRILGENGGWRPSLMPLYIDEVVKAIEKNDITECDPIILRKEVIKKMKELDSILFQHI